MVLEKLWLRYANYIQSAKKHAYFTFTIIKPWLIFIMGGLIWFLSDLMRSNWVSKGF